MGFLRVFSLGGGRFLSAARRSSRCTIASNPSTLSLLLIILRDPHRVFKCYEHNLVAKLDYDEQRYYLYE